MSYPNFFNLCSDWTDFFYNEEMEKKLLPIFESLKKEKKYYPDPENIFKCFYLTYLSTIKAVIIGQDPYHNGSATGLCFEVKLGNSLNPSLQNIYKELEAEGFCPTRDGNLEQWAKQGVLMLNSALTVREGEPESHLDLWEDMFKDVLEKLSEKEFIVWIILGKKAADYKEYITNPNHIILEASHPSPFSANRDSNTQTAFIGSGIFKNVNQELYKKGIDKISW